MVPWLNKKEMLKAPHSILPEHLVRRSQSTMQVQPRHVGTHGTPTAAAGDGRRFVLPCKPFQKVVKSGGSTTPVMISQLADLNAPIWAEKLSVRFW